MTGILYQLTGAQQAYLVVCLGFYCIYPQQADRIEPPPTFAKMDS